MNVSTFQSRSVKKILPMSLFRRRKRYFISLVFFYFGNKGSNILARNKYKLVRHKSYILCMSCCGEYATHREMINYLSQRLISSSLFAQSQRTLKIENWKKVSFVKILKYSVISIILLFFFNQSVFVHAFDRDIWRKRKKLSMFLCFMHRWVYFSSRKIAVVNWKNKMYPIHAVDIYCTQFISLILLFCFVMLVHIKNRKSI